VGITQPKLAELVRTLVEGTKRRTFRVEELFAGVNPQLRDPLTTSTTRTDAGHRATRALSNSNALPCAIVVSHIGQLNLGFPPWL
jgi:hypothetical protein